MKKKERSRQQCSATFVKREREIQKDQWTSRNEEERKRERQIEKQKDQWTSRNEE